MTISGEIPAEDLSSQVELIPAESAQTYIFDLKGRLEALDGPEIKLVHDMETGTSDIIVADLQNALLENLNITELPLFLVIESCFKNNINFRIWYANNDIDALVNNCEEVYDVASTLEAMKSCSGACWHAC